MLTKYMLEDIKDAGIDHPIVKAWLANRKAIKLCTSKAELGQKILTGATLWRAVRNRAKHVRAARKGWEHRNAK